MDEPTHPGKHFLTYNEHLSLILTPKQAKPVKRKAPKKIARKNGIVVLKNFLDLPLDVVYETFGYLDPTDLLKLSRLTKDFRALFMSRTSISIWRRVLGDVEGLPKCPDDMTEPQYASLMFDKFCMACGSTRGSIITEYNTRLRLCATCTKTNICHGYALNNENEILTALSIIPYYAPASGSYVQSSANGLHRLSRYYFKPELYRALHEVETQIELDANDYRTFVEEQQSVAQRIVDQGTALQSYAYQVQHNQQDIDEQITQRRYARIKEEMEKMGWEERYFPSEGGLEWNAFIGSGGTPVWDCERWTEMMYQAKEFSSRNWTSIRPKLTEIYTRHRRLHKQALLTKLLSSTYIEHRATWGDKERRSLPPWRDLEVGAMKEFLKTMWDLDWERFGRGADAGGSEGGVNGGGSGWEVKIEVGAAAGEGASPGVAGATGTTNTDDKSQRSSCEACGNECTNCLLQQVVATVCTRMVDGGIWEKALARQLAELVVKVDEEQARVLGSRAKGEVEGKDKNMDKDTPVTTVTADTDTITALSEKAKGKQEGISASSLALEVQGEGDGGAASMPSDVLSLARNLFVCECSLCINPAPSTSILYTSQAHPNRSIGPGRVISYPYLINHIVDHAGTGKQWSRMKPQAVGRVLYAARDVLFALGLEEGVSRRVVDRLGMPGGGDEDVDEDVDEQKEMDKAKFVCGCRHHRFDGPLSFEMLVEHIYEQQFAHVLLLNTVDRNSLYLIDEILVDGHSRERLGELIHVVTDADNGRGKGKPTTKEDNRTAGQSTLVPVDANENPAGGEDATMDVADTATGEDREEGPGNQQQQRVPDVLPGTFCCYCYQLKLHASPARDEVMQYHIKYMHGRDYEDGDFDTLLNLVEEYGEQDDDDSDDDDDLFTFPFNIPFSIFFP